MKKDCKKDEESNKIVLLKLSLYLISLWILFFMLIVLKLDICSLCQDIKNKDFIMLIRNNCVGVVSVILIILGLIGYIFFKDCLNDTKNLPVKITECESINYENLSFLATYIIPLVCFPMETGRQIFVLFAVILIAGCIFVKTNLYYTNPSLVLVGFNVYKVKTDATGGFSSGILIVQGKIKKSDNIKYFQLSDNVYFGRRQKNENK